MMRRPDRHHRGALRLATAAITAVLALGASCTPPPDPLDPNNLPPDINLMTDEQAEIGLAAIAEKTLTAYEDPAVRAAIPRDQVTNVDRMLDLLRTKDGRLQLVGQIRELALTATHTLPQRAETIDLGSLALSAADDLSVSTPPTIRGVRTPPPSGPGTINDGAPIGAFVNVGPPSTASCGAPNGAGTLAAPTGPAPGQLITPQHDVFTRTSPGSLVTPDGPLMPAGAPSSTGGSGIELRTVSSTVQQMRVQIHLDDPKRFGPGALYPLINLRPIGGTAADESRATITDGRIYCYAGDAAGSTRGYFDGWVTIPRTEPGFQVITEVVENDWFFRCTLDNAARCDLLLSGLQPQYWAGADRATIHAGAAPLTNAAALPASVGAFATAAPDPTAANNVVTNTDGEMGNDIEAAIHLLLDQTVRSKVASKLAGDLVDYVVVYAQARPRGTVETNIDLSFRTDPLLAGGTTAPPGTGMLSANASVRVPAWFSASLLGIECDNISADIRTTLTADVWADSAGSSTGITPRIRSNVTSSVNLDMAIGQWANPVCVITRGIAAVIADGQVTSAVSDGVTEAFTEDDDGNPGAVKKLLEGLDLTGYLPTIDLTTFLEGTPVAGAPAIKPVVTNLDNAWCLAANPPAGCTRDQNLIGREGPAVVADATLVSSLGQALGGNLEGRFRNVFAPTTFSSVADLTNAHRDSTQQMSGLGVVIDPRLINLALRHLAQGKSLSTTTDGLLDIPGVASGTGWGVTVRPEVAPMVLGVPPGPSICTVNCPFPSPPSRPLVATSLPDLRVGVTLGANSGPPVQFSVATSVSVGAGYDGAAERLKPQFSVAQLDIQVTGNCKVDYTAAYALSYTICGRGSAGAGATTGPANGQPTPISLTSVIGFLLNTKVLPLLDTAIGGIELPALDGIIPGLNASFTNVRLEQRGGFLAVYANLRPTPRMAIQPSTEGTGAAQVVRFFPSQVFGIDLTLPGTTYAWEVRDDVTGALVATTNVAFTPPNTAKQALISAFTETTGNFGKERRARAKLVVTQGQIQVTANAVFTWYPPAPPPNNPCAGVPGGSLRAAGPVAPAAAPGC